MKKIELPSINNYRTLPEGFINWGAYSNALVDVISQLSEENIRLKHFILNYSHIECSEVNKECRNTSCLSCEFHDKDAQELLEMVCRGEYNE